MPTAATTGTAPNGAKSGGAKTAMPAVRFARASAKHLESFQTVTRQITTSEQDLGTLEVPAYGYMGSIVIQVDVSGGTGGAPNWTPTEDAPFTLLKNIYLSEPNGSNIAIFRSGYDCFLANKFGGYTPVLGADPRGLKSFTQVPSNGSAFKFRLRIPVQINQNNALGALGNQNAAASFKLRMSLGSVADIATGTAPTTLPTATIKAFFEGWDQPSGESGGQVNQTTPPVLNTTQFWSRQDFAVNAGDFSVRSTRVGNWLRNLIFIYRVSGSRATGDTNFPNTSFLTLDTRPVYSNFDKTYWRDLMSERTGYGVARGTNIPANDSAQGLENGVFFFDYMSDGDGLLGNEARDMWQPSLASTRYELRGDFGAAGTLTVLTNDVAPAGNVWT